MSLPNIKYCPGTLAEGFDTFSPTCLKRVFNGKKVSHILPYDPPDMSEEDAEKFQQNRKRLSISGVQEKVSLLLEKNTLRLTEEGEQGTYILKPIPRDLRKVDQVPANEHLTMQIARQVFDIHTAENALIFFKNGDPAYITKRFDVAEDGKKIGKEDFATLAGKTAETAGPNFKYEYSYEEMAELVQKYIPAAMVELEKLFSLILFNYLICNGDAHLKNYGVIETKQGDYILSPAYDLINTSLHVDDTAMALDEGLFKDDFTTESFEANAFYAYDDFYEFGLKIGLVESRMVKILNHFRSHQENVQSLTKRSFLNEEMKRAYMDSYLNKLKALNYSMEGRV
ncbi:type II toxin-antitoxin system HipA family toxin [Rhodohalobacter sp. SW132]|uniref:type II toxin-antitoxin system HipA family toxin n=1 Tax=Rhodohalobacter sp. SW132 TaxID=2293433 RepID=UPI000E25FD45|nr:HipA domain-containing protein [Rhodohalobacter sp. SW132]REL32978.1 type II toxin-antitoxin system HipA family toxin [Rhodohalobacter sp. SW132]